MSNNNTVFYWASSWIIKNKDWKILFLKRAKNSKINPWLYQIPWGHMDHFNEQPEEVLIREFKEEVWIDVTKYKMVHIVRHLEKSKELHYVAFYFEILEYKWEIINNEPHNCDGISFLDPFWEDSNYQFSPVWKEVLKNISKWEFYSYIDVDKI